MRNFLLVIVVFALFGCSTSPKKLEVNNFQSEIRATLVDATLHSARYVGHEQDCFPPITNRLCKKQNSDDLLYSKASDLAMEILEFSIRFQESGLNTEVADEFIFLSAAELGLKRGYTMFTPLESSVVISCSKQATVIGSGIFTSPTGGGVGTFSTQSSRVVSQTCQNSTSSKFIFFNDKNLLRNGVFIQRHSGPSASDRVSPLLPLYFGTTPNIRIPDVISIDGYIRSDSWPYQGWKVHYDSYAVSQKLREKHKVTGEINYKIISEVSSRENTLRTLEQKEP